MGHGFGAFAHADRYDRVTRHKLRRMRARIVADVAAAELEPGARILDAGTGPGRLPLAIAAALPQVTVGTIDLSPEMIEQARRNAAGHGRVTFTVADVARLPFADETFDVVVSSLSQHHWVDPESGLRDLHRVLRPGGRLWIYDLRWALVVRRSRLVRCSTPHRYGVSRSAPAVFRCGSSPDCRPYGEVLTRQAEPLGVDLRGGTFSCPQAAQHGRRSSAAARRRTRPARRCPARARSGCSGSNGCSAACRRRYARSARAARRPRRRASVLQLPQQHRVGRGRAPGRARRRGRSSSSSSARIGVMPTPPAMSSVASRVRCRVVNAPYGPSAKTRVPTGRWRSPALVVADGLRGQPQRRGRPGAADSENGLACHQRLWPGNRQMKNWPARAGSRSRSPAGDVDRDDVVRLGHDRGDPELVAGVARTAASTSRPMIRATRANAHRPTSTTWPRA